MGMLLTCSAIRPQKGKFSSLTFHRGRKALCVNSFYSCMSMEVEKDGLTLPAQCISSVSRQPGEAEAEHMVGVVRTSLPVIDFPLLTAATSTLVCIMRD